MVRNLPGPTPGRTNASGPPICQQNIEASIHSLHSEQSDTENTAHIEVHQQGVSRRSSTEDLVGLAGWTERDGFLKVIWKKHPQATDIPYPSRRIIRNQSHDTSLHFPSL